MRASWSPMDLGLGIAGDLPTSWGNSDNSEAPVEVPGEGGQMIPDEMAALQQAPAVQPRPAAPRNSVALSPSKPPSAMPSEPLSALAAAQAKGLLVGAELDSSATDDTAGFATAAAAVAPSDTAAKQPQYKDEYDVVPDSNDHQDHEAENAASSKEASTREDLDRLRRGDTEAVKHEHKRRPALVKRVKSMAAAQQQAKTSKVAVKAVAVADQPAGGNKMMGQCMAFASWVKGQATTGPDLVRVWKGTCLPTVMAGGASPQYTNMCDGLGTAVGKFALSPWTPAEICQAVLQVFRESGVGSTPLAG